jgi:hypothetical protein
MDLKDVIDLAVISVADLTPAIKIAVLAQKFDPDLSSGVVAGYGLSGDPFSQDAPNETTVDLRKLRTKQVLMILARSQLSLT